MTNEQAFPSVSGQKRTAGELSITDIASEHSGLTKRELFSCLIMQGMLASWPGGGGGFEEVAAKAIKAADALLKGLAK